MKRPTDGSTATRVRESAEERRRQILVAAVAEFAARGLRAASIEDVATRVGVSQPYVYKLFGTKRDLFLAALALVQGRVRTAFQEAAAAEPGDVLGAMGRSYSRALIGQDEGRLLLQGFVASDDEEVREAVREGYAELWRFVAETSGASQEEIFTFFAVGLLLTVDAVVGFLERLKGKE